MDSDRLASMCNDDAVFRMAARFWNGSLALDVDPPLNLTISDGVAAAAALVPEAHRDHRAGAVALEASSALWDQLLAAIPPAQCSDLGSARHAGLKVRGDDEAFAQHFGAIARVLELLRIDRHGDLPSSGPVVRQQAAIAPTDACDAPVGRYFHVELGDADDRHDYRIYVETAGEGIPLLLQHTAGAHSAQWRHLFEDPWITDHFQLVAYDLPFHGKSLPPSGKAWWTEPYRLTTEFLMSVPLGVADVLGLDDPVFMGCSIGGLLALDLARFHPDRFRAVIGVEPALKVGGRYDAMQLLWHPRVDSGYKAALMEGLMAPQSPEAYRKETAFVYAQGWPPAFLGDVYFYVVDHDLRGDASQIDTASVGVHLLSGEYDWSATPDAGREAHEAIAGSTWSMMPGLGHFPMSEHPEEFLMHLRPVLEQILQSASGEARGGVRA